MAGSLELLELCMLQSICDTLERKLAVPASLQQCHEAQGAKE